MKRKTAEIIARLGPSPGSTASTASPMTASACGFAAGDRLNAFDPASGKTLRSIDVAAHAGTAFDGRHLFQIAEDRIQKIDPETGRVLSDNSGAWRRRRLLGSPGPKERSGSGNIGTGRSTRSIPRPGAILRTIESNRFVTGVTWVDGELWHGTWEGDESDLRRIDPASGRRFWRGSTCRPASACRGSSRMAATGSSAEAEAEAAGR